MVSICVATYNSEKFIANTLESIRKQTYRDFEVIIVDDHSTDNTVNIILDFCLKDPRFKLYLNCTFRDKVYYDAHNKSYEYANGEYLIRIDNDDIYELDFVSTIIKHMIDENLVACCLSQDFYTYDNDMMFKDFNFVEKPDIENFNINPPLQWFKCCHGLTYDAYWENNNSCIRKDFLNSHPSIKYISKYIGDGIFWLQVFTTNVKVKKFKELKTHKVDYSFSGGKQDDYDNYNKLSYDMIFASKFSSKAYINYFKDNYDFPNVDTFFIDSLEKQENTYYYFKNLLNDYEL